MQRSKPYPLRSLEVSFLVEVVGRKNGSPSPPPGSLSFFGLNRGLYLPRTCLSFRFTGRLIVHCPPVFACLLLHCCCSTGTSLLCAINRSSVFFLLSIQIHLCDLVRSLYVDITVGNQRKSQGLIWKVLSAGIPCLLMAISYGGLCEFIHVCHGSLMVSSSLMTNTCH